MKRLGKVALLYRSIFLLLFAIISLAASQKVEAADSPVTIRIHQRFFSNKDKVPDLQNNGDQKNSNLGKPGAKITFNVYDVTSAFHQLLKDGYSEIEIQDEISNKPTKYIKNLKIKMSGTTDSTGTVSFNLQKQRAYLFIEDDPGNVVKTQNFVVSIPNRYKDKVFNVYPKNVLKNPDVIATGEKRFIKVDLSTNKPLAHAKFVVSKLDGKYLDDTGKWKVVNDKLSDKSSSEDLKILESSADGEFQITGLKVGAYTLHEIEAPKGYVLPKHGVNFNVVAGEYNKPDVQRLKIFNQPAKNGEVIDGSPDEWTAGPDFNSGVGDAESSRPDLNFLNKVIQKILPQTGEAKTATWLGLLFVLISLGYLISISKRRRNEDE